MSTDRDPISILMADDDADDRMLAERALRKGFPQSTVFRTVADGEELLAYLRGAPAEERPDLVLLDLNMPRMDGREALRAIKADADLCRIPVVVLTTSQAEQDVIRSYELGVNAFVTKPVTFEKLVEAMRVIGTFWFGLAKLPSHRRRTRQGA